nr:hypothetical protein CPGR_02410 [Mycolicibacter nonchromogenicus]
MQSSWHAWASGGSGLRGVPSRSGTAAGAATPTGMTPGTAEAFEGPPADPLTRGSVDSICLPALGRWETYETLMREVQPGIAAISGRSRNHHDVSANGYSRSAIALDAAPTRWRGLSSVSQITSFLWAGPLEMAGYASISPLAAGSSARCRGLSSIICPTSSRSSNRSRPRRPPTAREPHSPGRPVKRPRGIIKSNPHRLDIQRPAKPRRISLPYKRFRF